MIKHNSYLNIFVSNDNQVIEYNPTSGGIFLNTYSSGNSNQEWVLVYFSPYYVFEPSSNTNLRFAIIGTTITTTAYPPANISTIHFGLATSPSNCPTTTCPPNYYYSSSSCLACPSGTTSRPGATACYACLDGYGDVSGVCTICPAGI